MNSPIIQLLVLAGIAVFLILRLRGVLGTREGYEKPAVTRPTEERRGKPEFDVIEGGPDLDITDHVDEDSVAAKALSSMKRVDPSFNVSDFLGGARGAYEMILMAFENGDLDDVVPFLSEDVYEAFASVVDDRQQKGLTVEAKFIGISDMTLVAAEFDEATTEGEITVRFKSEITSVVRDNAGDIVEGSEKEIKRMKDTWTFMRQMNSEDPNWRLVATGE
ncbi:Tim44/TimA family putative adaptor protein [Yoonia sediminilitoris]|uniref:Putative lipid-binding transport protein (Tim44 family) n=1 Tax=Yoonia sediminilitoris TaxID=1286148 RepID=A0A2T6KM01_9RHOB|nr:Tim44/TimA family putative adaptor protein [Yoonia sediminilitoris]PUB17187.1 putative lipid-binding transport protein (Tim44 family) [Yoonia sediminilitoris]RCW97482.1 putative lipid-binding transport protein (Tim44 family) [Yoonia sediminilitoris]